MLATDYYWKRAEEALAKADRPSVSECFVSIAMIYQSLADGEGELHRRFPNIPPRHIDEHPAPEILHGGRLERETTLAGQVAPVPIDIPVPSIAVGWAVAGHGFNALISRLVP
jgi:hypothetical protein